MNLEVEVLRARPKHAAVLTQITLAAKRHWNYPARWIQFWLPQLTITPDYIESHETWMALVGEAVVAYYSLKQEEEQLWLDNLWVLPGRVGRGLGKSLLGHAVARCRERGASTLRIESDPNAQGFYEKMGARKIGEHFLEVDGRPRVLPVMEIIL